MAVSLISSRFHDSTVIVPEIFFSSTRTFFPAGYRFERRCCALTVLTLSAPQTSNAANSTSFG